jgi:hypothetical protein
LGCSRGSAQGGGAGRRPPTPGRPAAGHTWRLGNAAACQLRTRRAQAAAAHAPVVEGLRVRAAGGSGHLWAPLVTAARRQRSGLSARPQRSPRAPSPRPPRPALRPRATAGPLAAEEGAPGLARPWGTAVGPVRARAPFLSAAPPPAAVTALPRTFRTYSFVSSCCQPFSMEPSSVIESPSSTNMGLKALTPSTTLPRSRAGWARQRRGPGQQRPDAAGAACGTPPAAPAHALQQQGPPRPTGA